MKTSVADVGVSKACLESTSATISWLAQRVRSRLQDKPSRDSRSLGCAGCQPDGGINKSMVAGEGPVKIETS